MEESTTSSGPRARKKPFVLFRVIQWAIVAFLGVTVLGLLIELPKLRLPDAPVAIFWMALATMAIVAILHSPPVFFRLARKIRVGAYIGIVISFILFGTYLQRMEPIWSKTPEGAKEAAERAKADVVNDALARAEKKMADATATLNKELDAQEAMEACFSWSHQLSGFNNQVQEALHNPGAFEHVKTEVTGSSTDERNVTLTFRAENGFGATRTAQVMAHLNPGDCSISNVGEFQTD